MSKITGSSVQWKRIQVGQTTYFQAKFPFEHGHFTLHLFGTGNCRVFVDVDPPGLDAKELLELGTRIVSVIYSLTGKHVSFNDLMINNLKELNIDSSDPKLRGLLHLTGIKHGFMFSELLETYWRIYEKTGTTVRVETGGKNAIELYQAMRAPVSALESWARLPDRVKAMIDSRCDEISQQVEVVRLGQLSVDQRSSRQEELITKNIAVTETLAEVLSGFINQVSSLGEQLSGFITELRKDRTSREARDAKLMDTVEVLLCREEIQREFGPTHEEKVKKADS
jgi:hypothetical protein